MPITRPLITMPTARPRRSGAARCAANGTNICGDTENRPTKKMAAASHTYEVAIATPIRLIAAPVSIRRIRRRRSLMSPSGRNSSTPIAKPIWPSITITPIAGGEAPNARPISASSGWM